MRKMLISVEIGEAHTFCKGWGLSWMSSLPAWKAAHGGRTSQRRLLVELAYAATTPPPCRSPASSLVRYVLGLPGLLCPEGTMWGFVLHKQHLMIKVFFIPPSFGLPGVLLCWDILDEGFWNSFHTCSFREWLFLCTLTFLSQAGSEGQKSSEESQSSVFVVHWESGQPWTHSSLLTALQELSESSSSWVVYIYTPLVQKGQYYSERLF